MVAARMAPANASIAVLVDAIIDGAICRVARHVACHITSPKSHIPSPHGVTSTRMSISA